VNEQIIVNPADSLEDGQSVNIAPPQSPSSQPAQPQQKGSPS
jgi:hypothetical protein